MSFPIPSFFKIRCGIIIIAFLLFFMFIGMLKQALAYDLYTETFRQQYATQAQAYAACLTYSNYHHHEGPLPAGTYSDGLKSNYQFYVSYAPNGEDWYYGVYEINPSLSSCPDTNNNGKPDACDTCPSQTGYKSDVLGVITYCGNTTTQCNGESHTDYEWGFSSDNCTPAQEPDCHVTADCKRDTDGDGIADDTDSDIDNDGIPNAQDNDDDNDMIPDDKDVDGDKDGDGTPNGQDACPGNSDPNCVNPCAGITDGTCKDTDGDGIKDSEDDDIDGDGIPNANDDDIDGDGDPNTTDTDDDGDGKPDDEDTCPSGKGTSGCDEDGNGTPDELEDTATRPYKSEVDPYSVSESSSSEFKEALNARFQEFLNKLKTTSLFSIPSRLNNIVPTGSGDSKIIVDGGQTYGRNEIDFSGWTQGLAALNAVIYIACYSIAIRIIILKR